jgi:hypothetical protein
MPYHFNWNELILYSSGLTIFKKMVILNHPGKLAKEYSFEDFDGLSSISGYVLEL